jgi:signal transduction histidine kinase
MKSIAPIDRNQQLFKELVDWILDKIHKDCRRPRPTAIIGIYMELGESIFTKNAERRHLNDFCKAMLGDPRLAKKCYADHKERGLLAGMQGEKEIKPCHCGLYNLSWPIIVSGKPVGTILAGQKLIANKLQETEEIFERFLSQNKELITDRNRLETLHRKTPVVPETYFRELIEFLEEGYNHIFQVFYERQKLESLREFGKKRRAIISHKLTTYQSGAKADLDEIFYYLEAGDIDNALKYLDHLEQSLAHLTNVTSNLLWLKSQIVPYFKEWDIHRLVRKSLKTFDRYIDHNGLVVNLALEADSRRLVCSKLHIKQLIDNLLFNAILYSNGRHVDIKTSTTAEGFCLSFGNYGVEISEKKQEDIFSVNYMGILAPGLGLTVAKRIAEAHGGGIRVDSRPVGNEVFMNTFEVFLQSDLTIM